MENLYLYVVIAYRVGGTSNYYIVGVFIDSDDAIACAKSHVKYCNGKYDCHVDRVIADYFNNNDNKHSDTIYKTKSFNECKVKVITEGKTKGNVKQNSDKYPIGKPPKPML